MFIETEELAKGSKVRLTSNYSIKGGVYTRGHEFIILGWDASWFYDLQDEEGRKVLGVSSNYFEAV